MKRVILLLVWIVSLQYVMAQDYPDLQINIRYNPCHSICFRRVA